MIVEWQIKVPDHQRPTSCVVGLPGRGNSASAMLEMLDDLELPNTLYVSLRAFGYKWYPQPISSLEQSAAVNGLPVAQAAIENALDVIKRGWNIPREKTCLMGFSAGAVMSLYVASHSKHPLACVASLSGAILEPKKLPKCIHPDMPIQLVHNQDDICFDWHERYLPMKQALISKGYNVSTQEHSHGGHHVFRANLFHLSNFIGPRLGYGEDWKHPYFIENSDE